MVPTLDTGQTRHLSRLKKTLFLLPAVRNSSSSPAPTSFHPGSVVDLTKDISKSSQRTPSMQEHLEGKGDIGPNACLVFSWSINPGQARHNYKPDLITCIDQSERCRFGPIGHNTPFVYAP